MFIDKKNKVIIYKSSIANTIANSGGIAYMNDENHFYFLKSYSLKMLATNNGGCFYVNDKNFIDIANSTFDDQKCNGNGAFMHNNNNNTIIYEKFTYISNSYS